MSAEPLDVIRADSPLTDLTAVEPAPRFWLVRWITSSHLRWFLLVALYVIVQPPEKGLGIDLCSLHRWSGAPCPGCGMTRSGANFARGTWDIVTGASDHAAQRFRKAFQFHPFGYVFIPVLFGMAGLSLTPMAWRQAIARGISRHQRAWRVGYLIFLWAFIAFGLARFVAVLAGWMAFPAEW